MHTEVAARTAAHSMVADRIADCNIVVVRTVAARTADRIGFVVVVARIAAHIVVVRMVAARTDFVERTVAVHIAVARTVVERTDFVVHTAVASTVAERTVVAHIVVARTAVERTADRIGLVVVVGRTVVAHIVVARTAVARTVVERTDFVSIVESPAAVE